MWLGGRIWPCGGLQRAAHGLNTFARPAKQRDAVECTGRAACRLIHARRCTKPGDRLRAGHSSMQAGCCQSLAHTSQARWLTGWRPGSLCSAAPCSCPAGRTGPDSGTSRCDVSRLGAPRALQPRLPLPSMLISLGPASGVWHWLCTWRRPACWLPCMADCRCLVGPGSDHAGPAQRAHQELIERVAPVRALRQGRMDAGHRGRGLHHVSEPRPAVGPGLVGLHRPPHELHGCTCLSMQMQLACR